MLFEEFTAAIQIYQNTVVAPSSARLGGLDSHDLDKILDMTEYIRAISSREARKALALGLAGLWESQFREHLWLSAAIFGSERGVEASAVEKARTPELESAFSALRGFSLGEIPSYSKLRALMELANAIRHGNGRSSDRAYKLYPEYFSNQRPFAGHYSYFLHGAAPKDDVRHIELTDKHLTDFGAAALEFWADLKRRRGNSS